MTTIVDATTAAGAVRAFLAQWAQIGVLMGLNYAGRIRTDRIPSSEGTGDRIRIQRIDTDEKRVLTGRVLRNHVSRVQVDVFSRVPQRRDNLAQEVRIAMRAFAVSGGWGNLQIIAVAKVVDQDLADDPQDGSEDADYRTLFQFDVSHKNLTE